MSELTVEVDKKCLNILSTTFLLVHRQKSSETNEEEVFSTYLTIGKYDYRLMGLEFPPIEKEESKGSDEHSEFLTIFLSVYLKEFGNFVAVIAENVSINQ